MKIEKTLVILVILAIYGTAASAITNPPTNTLSGTATASSTADATYYRGLGQYPNIVETSDLLKAADDWRDNIIPPGFSASITTDKLLVLADEWRTNIPPVTTPTPTPTTPPNKTGLPTIRFITIGDTHIASTSGSTNDDPYLRFTRAINYINNRTDVDFVVQMGDIAESSDTAGQTALSIISKLKVPYYVLEGNHGSGPYFAKYFGKNVHTEYFPTVNDYQLIFPGYDDANTSWIFDYNTVDKNRPTIIFNHGQVQPKPGGTSCIDDWGSYYQYACSMRSEVDKFTKLLGFYDGHVHSGSQQIINGTLFVSEDNLGGNGPASDVIGYTIIQDGKVNYTTVQY